MMDGWIHYFGEHVFALWKYVDFSTQLWNLLGPSLGDVYIYAVQFGSNKFSNPFLGTLCVNGLIILIIKKQVFSLCQIIKLEYISIG